MYIWTHAFYVLCMNYVHMYKKSSTCMYTCKDVCMYVYERYCGQKAFQRHHQQRKYKMILSFQTKSFLIRISTHCRRHMAFHLKNVGVGWGGTCSHSIYITSEIYVDRARFPMKSAIQSPPPSIARRLFFGTTFFGKVKKKCAQKVDGCLKKEEKKNLCILEFNFWRNKYSLYTGCSGNLGFFTIHCNPSLAYIAVSPLKTLIAMRVYSHSYWLVFFFPTNSSRVLARVRWQSLRILGKKHNI